MAERDDPDRSLDALCRSAATSSIVGFDRADVELGRRQVSYRGRLSRRVIPDWSVYHGSRRFDLDLH